MGVLASWNDHEFTVDASKIYGFNDLSVKGSSNTEDKGGPYKYVKRKEGKPYEVSFLIQLDKRLGVEDVRTEAMAWVAEARKGAQDFITVAGTRLFTCKFMLTEANAQKVEMTPSGEWYAAEVKVTFKASSKSYKTTDDTTSKTKTTTKKKSSGSSSSKKKSSGSKKKTVTTAPKIGYVATKSKGYNAKTTRPSSDKQIARLRSASTAASNK